MHDLLLISDLHLGSHLKPRLRGEEVHLASRIEESFPRFIDHYLRRSEQPGAAGVQLVVNGDFIDFWNIELEHNPNDDGERLAVRRLHAVLDAHPAVEDGLARFLDAGHGIVFVTGNHDAELLYSGVRAALAGRIEGAVPIKPGASTTGEPILELTDEQHANDGSITRTGMVRLDAMPPGKIRFVRWFLREEGGAWIEHGHKFDPSCATPAALSPTRGGALVQTVAEVATRSFANVMPEIDYDAPDKFTAMDYARWAIARGWRFVIRVVLLYLRMVGRILALWTGPGRVDKEGQEDHERQLGLVAANAGLQMSALTALEQMAPPPSAMTVAGLVKITAIDHILLLTVPLGVALLGRMFGFWPAWSASLVAIAVSVFGIYWLRRGRQRRDVARDMLEVAAKVGGVTGVPLVLMGHSHHGQLERRGDVVYANSGSWLDGSHLMVHRDRDSGRLTRVELRRWRNDGIMLEQVMDVPQEAAAEAIPGVEPDAPAPAQ